MLSLGEEIVGIAVQHHPTDEPDGYDLFRDQLGRVEDVERQRIGLGLRDELNAKFPFRKVP